MYLSCCCAVLERFDGGVGGLGVYDVVVPILWTLSCPSTEETVHGPTVSSGEVSEYDVKR